MLCFKCEDSAVMKYVELFLSFTGRINRSQYWLGTFVLAVFILGPAYFVYEPYSEESKRYVDIASLTMLWPGLALQIKRWHDRNKSGWWVLINFIPLIGVIWAIIENGFLSGNSGENQYGEAQGTLTANET